MNISIADLAASVARNLRTPPLCIIQARLGSTRLPNKMLLTLGGMSLIERAWRTACKAFGEANVVIAHPDTPENQPLVSHIDAMLARRFAFTGDENDVLGRFHACAHRYRWHPDSILHRWTPDDPFKDVDACRRVANGERLPVEIGGEAFTLAQLDFAHQVVWPTSLAEFSENAAGAREHITRALFEVLPPPAPVGEVWTIDTADDYEAALARLEREMARFEREAWDAERGAVA